MSKEIKAGEQYIADGGFFARVVTVKHVFKELAVCDSVRLRDGTAFEEAVFLDEFNRMNPYTEDEKEKFTFMAQVMLDSDVNEIQASSLYASGYRKVSEDE